MGKTSLIFRFLKDHPPERGRVAGVFCDVSGLPVDALMAKPPGEVLFRAITEGLECSPHNLPIRQALARRNGKGAARIPRLARDTEGLLSLHDRLEVLADRLHEHSDGVLDRLVLFIDEFDRFVMPMLGGRKAAVDQMLWDLRKIVQTSTRIAVVLAGSGLQRIFVDNPDRALHLSISEHYLEPFDWDRDRAASQATFLPHHVMDRVCRPAQYEELCATRTGSAGDSRTCWPCSATRRPCCSTASAGRGPASTRWSSGSPGASCKPRRDCYPARRHPSSLTRSERWPSGRSSSCPPPTSTWRG